MTSGLAQSGIASGMKSSEREDRVGREEERAARTR